MTKQQEVNSLFELFKTCVSDYHLKDDIDAAMPEPPDQQRAIFYEKCWVDTVQWHLEDEIRRDDIEPAEALAIKRRIDASNQKRTDLVEGIDDIYLDRFKGVSVKASARLNTESPAWAIDRLSILALKIYHMQAEVEREDVDRAHHDRCSRKLAVLHEQRDDLIASITQLLEDLESGDRIMKVYRQMKMYNDPQLNPVLYKANDKA